MARLPGGPTAMLRSPKLSHRLFNATFIASLLKSKAPAIELHGRSRHLVCQAPPQEALDHLGSMLRWGSSSSSVGTVMRARDYCACTNM
jgi:hypothetical protein